MEVNEVGINRRFVVTNRADLSPRPLYDHYSDRGQTENYIKAFKIHLKMDRLSCHRFWANQFRLLLHALAYQMFLILRDYLYATPSLEVETLRRRILKIGARVRQGVSGSTSAPHSLSKGSSGSSGADFTPLSCPARTENTIPELSPGMLCPDERSTRVPDAMEPKVLDTSPLTQASHELLALLVRPSRTRIPQDPGFRGISFPKTARKRLV